MEEINQDIVLRCLLSSCKTHTKEQAKIFSCLSNKVLYGNDIAYNAERYCVKQGWMEEKLVGESNDRGGKNYHRELVTNQYGLQQIPILWESSKVRPWNLWKHRIKVVAPWFIAILAISKSGTILEGLANVLKVILTSFSIH